MQHKSMLMGWKAHAANKGSNAGDDTVCKTSISTDLISSGFC